MQLLQMDVVDEDSQHTVELLSKSASLPAPAAAAAAGDALGSRDLGRAGSSRGPSNLRHTSGPNAAGLQASAAAGAAAGGRDAAGSRAGVKAGAAAGFSFKMFGKDAGSGGASAALQVGCLGWYRVQQEIVRPARGCMFWIFAVHGCLPASSFV